MTHRIPPGTRDVLPDEMREVRAISSSLRQTFEEAGYGEVHTPALEYEEVLRRGEEHAAGARYRSLLQGLGVDEAQHLPLLECLSRRDLVGLDMLVSRLGGLSERDRELL